MMARNTGILADRALLELAKSCFYLNQLDHFADQFVLARERADLDVDPAEVTIYLRSKLAREFNLPFYPLELLYSVDDYVTPAVIDDARRTLRRLGQSPALQEAILATEFWVEYLASSEPEAFFTVKDTITYKVSVLDQELSDRRSDEYLERRQQLADEETNEHNRLVRQLTEGTQRTLQRV